MEQLNLSNISYTTLDKEMYSKIQMLALTLSITEDKKINANDLIEEGMQYILNKYKEEK